MDGSQGLQLEQIFLELNDKHFEGGLPLPRLRWNTRLRSSAGRFVPGAKRFGYLLPPTIEVASYLTKLPDADHHVRDTVGHEMIHYWLWERRRPYGHTPEFYQKMTEMGVSRFNKTAPKKSPQYIYTCQHCHRVFEFIRKFKGRIACANCCKSHNRGRFDARFVLKLSKVLTPQERREWLLKSKEI